MCPLTNIKLSNHRNFYDRSFISRFSNVQSVCDESSSLIIVIYHLEKKKFIYYNEAFASIIGDKFQAILSGGWNNWFKHIIPDELYFVRNRIKNFISYPFDQNKLALSYHIQKPNNQLLFIKHEIILHKIGISTLACNYLFDVTDMEKVEHCLKANKELYSILNPSLNFYKISKREHQVLKLLSEGYSSKQIANILCISDHTAISHRKHLLEKFRVRNTAQLIMKASKTMML